ncbi:hypothetical protein F2Q69_00041970 [Brassica cretica]|uniref:C2H2-type domain-containing protein n=1 Tax=Brassica cretica TaxID=69181 RepID=A0A8S9NLJ6_BRACR|nr:hypothetical protein F2Q69_00041970 [Brassica cretica]
MMFTCQQLHISSNSNSNFDKDKIVTDFSPREIDRHNDFTKESSANFLGVQEIGRSSDLDQTTQNLDWYGTQTINPKKEDHRYKSRSGDYELVELGVADLLAKYTHYCQICGKGFKRDANQRMHMRAHGDEYKTSEALISPTSHDKKVECSSTRQFYSCPHHGRCNLKHFSVLSDLRTHEKHCGDVKWVCSCGTTFTRKDKLRVALSITTLLGRLNICLV